MAYCTTRRSQQYQQEEVSTSTAADGDEQNQEDQRMSTMNPTTYSSDTKQVEGQGAQQQNITLERKKKTVLKCRIYQTGLARQQHCVGHTLPCANPVIS
jgi:hypothetical protein